MIASKDARPIGAAGPKPQDSTLPAPPESGAANPVVGFIRVPGIPRQNDAAQMARWTEGAERGESEDAYEAICRTSD